MARIDIQTLVLAFEKRISELEKNPPDKVPTGVVLKLLENSIDDIIKDHFLHLVKVKLDEKIKKEFNARYEKYVSKTISNILNDDLFRENLETLLKQKMLKGLS